MKKYNAGNTNTILIVIVIIVVVALGAWYFAMRSAPAADNGGSIDINLPSGSADGSSTSTSGGATYP